MIRSARTRRGARTSSVLVVIVVVLATVGLGLAGVGALRVAEARRTAPVMPADQERGVTVRVAVATFRSVVFKVSTRGFLEPFEHVTLSAEVPGYVQARLVDVSDPVKEGDRLFQIDNAMHTTAVDKALADVDRARSELNLAAENRRRIEKLKVEESANATEVLRAETEYAKAEAAVKHAEAVVREARILLEKTTIVSPLTGVVARIHAREGEYAHVGQPLVDIIEVGRLKLVVELDDRQVVAFSAGDPVTMVVPALPGERFAGRILRIYPSAAPDSRRFGVEIEVPNPDGHLRPGFYVDATLTRRDDATGEAHRGPRILTVPRIAVLELYRQHYCYVVRRAPGEATDRAFRTAIRTVPVLSDPQYVQVLSGLAAGDRVVTTGLQHVTDQGLVRVIE